MGVGHHEDEGEGAFEEVDDDAVLSFDGLDAAGASLEGAVHNEDWAGILELLEFVCCEDANVFTVCLQGEE